jgi:hypothetical protein
MEARQKLVDLDLKHQELDALVERAKHAKCEDEKEQVITPICLIYLDIRHIFVISV